MSMGPEAVEALFQQKVDLGFATLGPAGDEGITAEESVWKALKLKDVLSAVRHAHETGSADLELLAEKIGDGSRDASWRVPLGESGILEFFLDLLSQGGLGQRLTIQSLRVIGNSSADTDENRAKVVESRVLEGSLLRLLDDDGILSFAIPVIFNICVDYEPAQLQASKAGLGNVLVGILSGHRLLQFQPLLGLICKILGLLVTQDPEMGLAKPETPSLLLGVATSPAYSLDLEEFTGLVSVALAYLTNEQFQPPFVRSGGFEILQGAFYNSHTQFDLTEADPEEAADLKQLWNVVVQIFADLSSLPDFVALYSLESQVVRRLVAWLGTSFIHLQVASCLCLGNLARSDEASTALVNDVYPYLAGILANSSVPPVTSTSPPSLPGSKTVSPPSQLLHGALSFLKNLAIAPANKPLIGQLLDPPQSTLPRLWSTTDVQPQTQFAAISLTRLLLVGCPENVRRICAPLSADPDSPAHERSNVHVLIDLWARVDAEPSKLEVARAIAAICRVLHLNPVLPILPDEWKATEDLESLAYNTKPPGASRSAEAASEGPRELSSNILGSHSTPVRIPASSPDAPEDEKRRAHFYVVHADMATPLAGLLSQTKFPTLRSEGLFVLALMCRSAGGGLIVLRALNAVETCAALIQTVTGEDLMDQLTGTSGRVLPAGDAETKAQDTELVDSLGLEPQQADPQQTASMARVDRQNGLVLVAELLKNFTETLPPIRRSIFEDVLAKGAALVANE
ncbi:hypothetical protein GQ53DRAFT_354673 [Thozetella sp. PMI_491]|nr:hypothetical protein GQ53DRAFT_354673 [Thozetella sp. PMI_491]